MAALLCLVTAINYLDRQAFAIAGPVIVKEFQLTNTQFGAVGSLGGALFVAAAGWVTEHYSYTPIFAAVGVMHLVSAAIIMLMIPDIKQLKQ